ncbi:uncharacterized protein LOC111190366 [Astyanax mexicanus]|uniref:uncharacterized protein LOC111190366 n=1 Tax=Astyanax mexicanus TaxID=7994 RepID=UPI0020CB3C24|nr:uncharacterized protein LOC111190366 [Astyanax mexicanus]XP_049333750.1 uncharacterized protein LOC111190366 [Astyanax mexicanus]XP_049333751.1 uncharacterized protein LOC111190366 [Astyanax mexicanus]XP_049333752.1 uncharacterized protein LOC111190366 [Astyanax mexicanus]XP_049333753.1 uncharacterized protein LOC111190366 [Astyanax mexicanus]XP_049333754.1 uncharacterized protein LOC111190366 [Astyanax mexicanus]
MGNEPSNDKKQSSSCPAKSATLAKPERNYCFVCGEAQTKIARHFKMHIKEDVEIARALSLPTNSKERKHLLEALRNKGNFSHNNDVLRKGEGSLKVKRRAFHCADSKKYEYCVHCKGMFLRQELWRHMRRCRSKPATSPSTSPSVGRKRVLTIATTATSILSGTTSAELLKLMSNMIDDNIAQNVRNDPGLLQFAQSLFNRHGHDKTKHEYIRQKLRELGRFLATLRKKNPSATMEDAMKPENFIDVTEAVRETAGFDQAENTFRTPSLALKIGHSLLKISELFQCQALISGDAELGKCADAFQKLYKTKWAECISHSALGTLSSLKYNKPNKLPLTQDIKKPEHPSPAHFTVCLHGTKQRGI